MSTSIASTKNYSLFDRSRENRPVNLSNRHRLRASMKEYGWLKAFPMFAQRTTNGRLIIIDGQHRFEIAKELGVAVRYIVDETKVDVVKLQGGASWVPKDYAGSFAQRGLKDYERVIEFAEKHNVPLTTAAALLAGTVCFGNVNTSFRDGSYKVKDELFADRVATIFSHMNAYGRFTSKRSCVDAIAACCRVGFFDVRRFLNNVKRCPEKLQPYATRDAVLLMMEEIYNYAQSKRVGLKAAAENAMRTRSAVGKKSAD
jgi:hypothetical protein